MNLWFAYAIAWISCALTSCYFLSVTHNIKCILILAIPLCIHASGESENKNKK